MADASTSAPVQTEIATAPAAAPAAAPVEAKAAEPAKAAPVVDGDAMRDLEKRAAKLEKAAKDAEAKAKDADDLRARLADALGLAKKADPAEAIAALQSKLAQREAKVARAILVESVRKAGIDFAQGVDPDDVLALMGSTDDAVDVDAFALKSPDDFKVKLSALLERKPYLRAPPPAPSRGLPSAPAQQPQAQQAKKEAAPAAPRRFGASSWFGGNSGTN